MKNIVSKNEITKLNKPRSGSHKGDNGSLFIIGGSKKYHGALLLAATIASKIVDLVYIFSDSENYGVIKKLKPKLFEFITISRIDIPEYIIKSDVVLAGPGLGTSAKERKLLNALLKKFPQKKFVLDADALKIVDMSLLNKNHIITPHHKEFEILFGLKATELNVGKMAKRFGCIIVLKGKKDIIASPTPKLVKFNITGNQGMTKGGTGDVLAGLIAALACTNDLFLSACAGPYLNGAAADKLLKKVSYNYSASDIVAEIPKLL
ncbi:NAD(P)H-hydrate dehydratase [Patescibacteria group bacterium]|nr:NAD(P)H-hydrate dehydratase [Patescibacteria group bacterium]